MIPQVLEAVEHAFHPTRTLDNLIESKGRIVGSVTVIGSPIFDDLDDIRRQRLFWERLRSILGYESTSIGPIVLEPTRRD